MHEAVGLIDEVHGGTGRYPIALVHAQHGI